MERSLIQDSISREENSKKRKAPSGRNEKKKALHNWIAHGLKLESEKPNSNVGAKDESGRFRRRSRCPRSFPEGSEEGLGFHEIPQNKFPRLRKIHVKIRKWKMDAMTPSTDVSAPFYTLQT